MASDDRPSWDIVRAGEAELGVGGQARLGEWGMPLIHEGESWVSVGVSVVWAVDEWGAWAGGKLHLGDTHVVLRESDWEARDGRTLCRKGMARMSRGRVAGKRSWVGVPTVLPAGAKVGREVPEGSEFCEVCARKVVLLTAGLKGLMEGSVGQKGVAVRPVTWRSRSIWGVEGEESYVADEVELVEGAEDLSATDETPEPVGG